jgi:hypothetical protein
MAAGGIAGLYNTWMTIPAEPVVLQEPTVDVSSGPVFLSPIHLSNRIRLVLRADLAFDQRPALRALEARDASAIRQSQLSGDAMSMDA